MLTEKTITCPCGNAHTIGTCPDPFTGEPIYDLMGHRCPQCDNAVTWCNVKTGEVFSWTSQRELDRINTEMENEEVLADIRDSWLAESEY